MVIAIDKKFFITGARSAGGVANLLSKKLIDKFGSNSVYGYTFNAVATINGNMIPKGSKIPNLKYAPIMNIYNDDEMMVMFTSEETNMYKYGTNVHMSLSDNYQGKVKTAFNKVHPKGYDKNMKSNVVDLLNRTFNINLSGYIARIFGMTGTEHRNWDDYSENEINKYSAKTIHEALSDDELEELFNFWSEFYNVTKNNSAFDHSLVVHAESQKSAIERIRNMRQDLGKDALESNTDSMAFNNAQTNAFNNTENKFAIIFD